MSSSLVAAVGVRIVWSAVTIACGRTTEDWEREEWTKGRKRTGDNTNAFFYDGPETDGAGAEHELGWIAVETQIAESDDCCTACAWRTLKLHMQTRKRDKLTMQPFQE